MYLYGICDNFFLRFSLLPFTFFFFCFCFCFCFCIAESVVYLFGAFQCKSCCLSKQYPLSTALVLKSFALIARALFYCCFFFFYSCSYNYSCCSWYCHGCWWLLLLIYVVIVVVVVYILLSILDARSFALLARLEWLPVSVVGTC